MSGIEILEATKAEQDRYGHNWGSEVIVLSPEHIQALQHGKMLAWNDAEYTTFVVLAEDEAACTRLEISGVV